MEPSDAELLSSFLLPMLHYYPDSRATAAEMVKHPWLDGVVVQGEMEMAEKRHQRDIERAKALSSSAASPAGAAGSPAPSSTSTVRENGAQNGGKEGKEGGEKSGGKKVLEDVLKLGPAVKGMVGLGRI